MIVVNKEGLLVYLPEIKKKDKTIHHIICEGSREHVIMWDSLGWITFIFIILVILLKIIYFIKQKIRKIYDDIVDYQTAKLEKNAKWL